MFKDIREGCGRDPGVGQPAKGFALKSPRGGDLKLTRYRKRVILLNFWSTWCEPCIKELPEFDLLYRRYRNHGLTLLAVATNEDAESVLAFIKQHKLAAKVAIGGQSLADAYRSPTLPFSYLLDKNQVIRASYIGYKHECLGSLERDIREQLEALRTSQARRSPSHNRRIRDNNIERQQ